MENDNWQMEAGRVGPRNFPFVISRSGGSGSLLTQLLGLQVSNIPLQRRCRCSGNLAHLLFGGLFRMICWAGDTGVRNLVDASDSGGRFLLLGIDRMGEISQGE